MSAKNIIYNMIEKYAGIKGIEEGLTVNIHHNYADMENHFKENVIVHRKGAIRMREGELGIIPGSMGTASYIVKGLGNEQSFMSASHGAGRRMGRKQAEKNLDPLEQERLMEGIITTSKLKDILDECPGAYKKIEDVIENEADLVSVVLKLKPLASIKGESEG